MLLRPLLIMRKKEIIIDEYNSEETVTMYSDFTENIGLLETEKLLLKRYASTGSKILDACCGAGRTTIGTYRIGFKKIIGVDICEAMIRAADRNSSQHSCKIDYRCCDVLEFEEKGFDLITFWFNSLMIIPNLQYRQSIIQHCISCLNNNGIIIITAPILPDGYDYNDEETNYSKTKYTFDFEYGDRVFDEQCYIHFPTDQEIERYFVGMTLLESDLFDNVCSQQGRGRSLSYKEKYWVYRR